MKMKKILAILLTLAMVLSLLPTAAFAANNTATTMRLAKTQGTVTVTNATGKKVSQTANMKLYNGYQLKTGAKSYAWISLDDTKVAKLDANSVLEVQKKGKELSLYLSSGNMFFNVKEKLKSGENLNIKTSTMTTGIRGTSGCVRVVSPRVTEVHLLTGEVLIYVEHPTLGIHKVATLQAGQKATSLIDWEAMAVSGEMADIIIELLQNHEICGICSREIADDPELLERIKEEAPHLLPELAAGEADDRLAADEAAAEEEQVAIEEAAANQDFPEEVDPYFEETASSGGGGGGGSAAPAETVVTVDSWEKLQQRLSEFTDSQQDMTITLAGNIPAENEVIDGNEPLHVADRGDTTLTLNLADYTLTLPGNTSIVNDGNLVVTNANGFIHHAVGGTIFQNNGTMTLQDGTIVLTGNADTGIKNTGTLHLSGGDIRSGTFKEGASTDAVGTAVENYGEVNMTAGIIEAAYGIINDVLGDEPEAGDPVVKISGGSLTCRGEGISVGDGCTATISGGTFTGNGNNSNFINNKGTTKITGGTFTANGGIPFILNDGKLTISGGTFNGNGGTGNEIVHNNNNAGDRVSEVNVSGGTFTLNGEGSVALSNTHKMNVTGGTINVNAAGATGILSGSDIGLDLLGTTTININVAAGAGEGATGLWVAGTGAVNTANLKITAYAGTGMQMEKAAVTFGSDTRIFAYGTAKALYQNTERPAELTRPITAIISAETKKENVYNNFDEYMSTIVMDTDTDTVRYRLVDSHGQASGAVVDEGTLKAAVTAANAQTEGEAVITLGASFTAAADTTLEGYTNTAVPLTIDLAGKNLTLTETYHVPAGVRLTITDSSADKNGKLIAPDYKSAIILAERTTESVGATVTLDAGTIESSPPTSTSSADVVINYSFDMGGENVGFFMTGGTIANTNIGGAVDNDGTFIMSGGEIISGDDTRTIGNRNARPFTMNGGTITYNGTGSAVSNSGIFNMNAGTIDAAGEDATAVDMGTNGTFNMNGGTVKAKAETVFATGDTLPAGYVVSEKGTDDYYTLVKDESGGTEAAVYEVTDWAKLTDAVDLFLDDTTKTSGTIILKKSVSALKYMEENPDAVISPLTIRVSKPLTIDLGANTLTLSDTMTVAPGADVTIQGTGTITGASGEAAITNNGNLTIAGGNITGNDSNYTNGTLNNRGTFTMNGGTLTTNGNSKAALLNYGTATIQGGVVDGATASAVYNDGGEVELTKTDSTEGRIQSETGAVTNNSGTFTLTAGSIESTKINSTVIGVVDNKAEFIMTGGSITNEGTGYGFDNTYGTFTMSGGKIEANVIAVHLEQGTFNISDTAEVISTTGNGVDNSGTVNMTGGSIEAKGSNTTVAIRDGKALNMSGGTIAATGTGTAVSNSGTFTFTGGTVSAKTEAAIYTGTLAEGSAEYEIVPADDIYILQLKVSAASASLEEEDFTEPAAEEEQEEVPANPIAEEAQEEVPVNPAAEEAQEEVLAEPAVEEEATPANPAAEEEATPAELAAEEEEPTEPPAA